MARSIVITSGKGGVGKTTVCANLGYALANTGLKVMMLDTDIGLNNLDVVLGVENKIVYDIIDVLNGKCRPRQALVQDFFVPNLYIMPSNHTYYNFNIEANDIKEVIKQVDEYFDYVLIDCPAGIEKGFNRAVACADEAIVVTTPHISAIRDADKTITLLRSMGVKETGIIVNRARGDLIIDGNMLSIETIGEYLNMDVLGVIPEDDAIAGQMLVGGGLSRKAEAYLAFKCVVDKLHEGNKQVYDCTKKYKGFVGNIKKNIKKWV